MSACFLLIDCPPNGMLPSLMEASDRFLVNLHEIATKDDSGNLYRPSDGALKILEVIKNEGKIGLENYLINSLTIKFDLEKLQELQALFIEYCDPETETHFAIGTSPLYGSRQHHLLINYHHQKFIEKLSEKKCEEGILEHFLKSLTYGRVNLSFLDTKIPFSYEYEIESDFYCSVFTKDELARINAEISKVLCCFVKGTAEYEFLDECYKFFESCITNNRGAIGTNLL